MSLEWDVIERISGTGIARREREFLLRRFGKIVRSHWRFVAEVAEKESEQIAAKAILVAGAVAAHAAEIYPHFAKRFPSVGKMSELEWAETIAKLMADGGTEALPAIRGVIVERFIPSMKQLAKLFTEMEQLAKAKGWGVPALVSGVRTIDGRELADWMIVSEHKDGRLWIMAFIESKSVSNTRDLIVRAETRVQRLARIAGGEERVGQHLWDFVRAKSGGIRVERVESGTVRYKQYLPAKLVAEVKPVSGPAPDLYTRFIGVIPEDFTPRQIRAIKAKGVEIEAWPWPVPRDEVTRLINELRKAFGQ